MPDNSPIPVSRQRSGSSGPRTRRTPVVVDVQYATSRRGVPHTRRLRAWAEQAFAAGPFPPGPRNPQPRSLVLRIVGAAESRRLNRQWRGKDKPTNVLSFPAGAVPRTDEPQPLGDIVICATVVRREAAEQAKTPTAHWAHMVVHGMLHLLGYDHEKARDAAVMEQLEALLLERGGFPNPYGSARP